MKEKILIVDDDPNILEVYRRKLHGTISVDVAQGPMQALHLLRDNGPYAVVISDLVMPLMNGIQFLARVEEEFPDTVRIVLTGDTESEAAIKAINEGHVFRFLTKPCPSEAFGKALVAGINQYRLVRAEKELLEDTLNGAVEVMVEIMSWLNPDAFGVALRLRSESRELARKLGIAKTWEIELAALLSPMGIALSKFGCASGLGAVLASGQQTLCPMELASQLISHVPRLGPVAKIIRYCEKFYDGSGNPEENISGNEIPIGARIVKVLSDLHALEKSGSSRRHAIQRMRNQGGRYDPVVLTALADMPDPKQRDVYVLAINADESGKYMLQCGDVLEADIWSIDQKLLYKAGHAVTEATLSRLRMFAQTVGLREPVRVWRPGQ